MSRRKAGLAAVIPLAIAAAAVMLLPHLGNAASAPLPSTSSAPATTPVAHQTPPAHETTPSQAGDYYSVLGPAQRPYAPSQPGVVEYCPLDQFGRAVCAYGDLTSTLRRTAEARGREQIAVAPAGWGENRSVTIAPVASTPGSRAYRGWFWNRSHLIADSLGGDPTKENLVTGTRPQNVGSTQVGGQYAGGMAFTEITARRYLDTHDGDTCPLYYAATPRYEGAEPIPRTVIVDIRSCDGAIDERVEVSNTANGWAIDYSTGTFLPAQ